MSKRWLTRRGKNAEPLLGKVSDETIAKRTGFSIKVVGNRRRELGIKPYGTPPLEAREVVILRVTVAQRRRLDRAGKKAGMQTAYWARHELLRLAKEALDGED